MTTRYCYHQLSFSGRHVLDPIGAGHVAFAASSVGRHDHASPSELWSGDEAGMTHSVAARLHPPGAMSAAEWSQATKN